LDIRCPSGIKLETGLEAGMSVSGGSYQEAGL